MVSPAGDLPDPTLYTLRDGDPQPPAAGAADGGRDPAKRRWLGGSAAGIQKSPPAIVAEEGEVSRYGVCSSVF
jgi:hypothetical protein